MARWRKTLGYSSMALYRYVAGKDELLMLMSDATAPDPPDLSGAGSWRDALELWAMSPDRDGGGPTLVPRSPLAGVLPGPQRTKWIDAAFGAMAGLDAPFETKLRVIGLLAQHVLGEARVTVESQRSAAASAARAGGLPVGTPVSEIPPGAAGRRRPVRRFRDSARQLRRSRALPRPVRGAPGGRGDVAQPASQGWREEAAIGVGVLLDGIELLLERAAGR